MTIRLPNGITLPQVLAASDSVAASTVTAEPFASRITRTLDLLDRALRAINRTPADVRISSILRSESRNEAVGGSQHSHHLSGYAVDFNVRGVAPFVVFQALRPLASQLNWDELAVYDGHVHLSSDPRQRRKILDLRSAARRRQPAPKATNKPGTATLAGVLLVVMLGLWALAHARGAELWK